MIDRILTTQLKEHLALFPAVALLGPRQVGKTTLARTFTSSTPGTYLDLENPADREKLSDPLGYLSGRGDSLTIIDEIQRVPGLFQVLRGIIDENILTGRRAEQFLLLGSASIDLLRQSSESLAGRIGYLELAPFSVLEVEPDQVIDLWIRGGFPPAFLAAGDRGSVLWRSNFIDTYLERDIPQLGPRIPAETLRRFWTMLAHAQGSLLNAAGFARSLGVDGKSVARYLDLLVDLLLLRRLPPFHTNARKRLVKSPKIYVRDSGLVHSLLRLGTTDDVLGHPVAGASWEGFVIENLVTSAPHGTESSFYRTATGVELDLILDLPGGHRWAIEIKCGMVPSPGKGFYTALEDIKPDRSFIVYGGTERYRKGDALEVIGLRELAELLRDLK
ncbi:MAG: ATP-binding protein [Spirochaeta sp.]|jgi:predicted AAA+ superfamily ATPase|nr:ATP-binding protein [Spirochaeta sp.]